MHKQFELATIVCPSLELGSETVHKQFELATSLPKFRARCWDTSLELGVGTVHKQFELTTIVCPSLELGCSATASNSDTFREFSCENIEKPSIVYVCYMLY